MPPSRSSSSAFRPEVRRALPVLIVFRLALNASGRMMFSFLPAFSTGTGLSVDQLGRFLSLRDLVGVGAPALAKLSDRHGTRRTMLGAVVLTAAGLGLISLGALGMLIGLVLWGIGRVSFLVAMNTWVANEVAYERRGRAIGQIEMSWAGAALIGLPLLGLLINNMSWRSAPLVLSAISLPLFFGLRSRLSPDETTTFTSKQRPQIGRSGWATIASIALLNFTFQLLVFAHGVWLKDEYGFNAAEVGFAIILVGLAELAGSFSSSRFTDVVGKRRSILVGTVVLLVGLCGLTAVNDPPLAVGLGLLAFSFFGFEYAVVSSIPLVSELDPLARAETIGRAMGLTIVARAIANLTAGEILAQLSPRDVFAAALAIGLVTFGATMFFVREPKITIGSNT